MNIQICEVIKKLDLKAFYIYELIYYPIAI